MGRPKVPVTSVEAGKADRRIFLELVFRIPNEFKQAKRFAVEQQLRERSIREVVDSNPVLFTIKCGVEQAGRTHAIIAGSSVWALLVC